VERAAERSYGLNVARLAELPAPVIARARDKSRELEAALAARERPSGHAHLGPLVREANALLRAGAPLDRAELARLQDDLQRRQL
jgi:DNA mismatch repair ATPase MutS